jgi:N-hydroxyarylamine O-acetyltransferase
MNSEQVDAYLARIGAARPGRADAGTLRELQLRHLLAVPFENLSIHLGEPIVLDEAALLDKIVRRRRGGFCYELNGAFAALLSALGYEVTLLAARVYGDGALGPPFDHLALRVDAPDPWLADVGFGRLSRHPLRLDDGGGSQLDPDAIFQLVRLSREHGDIDVTRDGEPQYRLEMRPRALADFAPTCWWQQTSPDSHFTRSLVCSRLTERGRVTLSDRRLVETIDGRRAERELAGDAELLSAYRDRFGIELDRLPPAPARSHD